VRIVELASGLHGIVATGSGARDGGTHDGSARVASGTAAPATLWTGGADPRRDGVARGSP
jgi:hypothetical protein